MNSARRSRRAASLLAAVCLAGLWLERPALVAGAAQSTAVRTLQHDIDALLDTPDLESGVWGVIVRSLQRDDTLYAVNSRKLLLPSSNLKILTLAAAAERLGWDFTYETRIDAVGTIDSGVLDGDLIVVGSGDPSIDNWDGAASRLFAEWASDLKAAGIRAVTGRIVGDDNAFDDEGLGAGWAWDDLDRSFATSIGALQFNENTAQASIAPGEAVGDDATVTIAPPGAALVVRNLAKTGMRGSPTTLAFERLPGRTTLDVLGLIPAGVKPVVRNVSVINPTLYFVNELKDALIANGIDVRGPAMDIDDIPKTAADSAGPARSPVTLITYRSPPLSTLATTMMKLSQNLYAETLLRTLGRTAGTPTSAGGIAVVRDVMTEWGVPPLSYSQADGSGLSRYNYVTAETLTDVLTHVSRDRRLADAFRQTLPIAGRDGTLENRMRRTPAEGNARAKSGSLARARSVSGYVSTADGEPLVFSILANNFGAPADVIDRATDAVVIRLARFSRR